VPWASGKEGESIVAVRSSTIVQFPRRLGEVLAVAEVEDIFEHLGKLGTRGKYSSSKKIIVTNLPSSSIV